MTTLGLTALDPAVLAMRNATVIDEHANYAALGDEALNFAMRVEESYSGADQTKRAAIVAHRTAVESGAWPAATKSKRR